MMIFFVSFISAFVASIITGVVCSYIYKKNHPCIGKIMVDHSIQDEDPYCFLCLDSAETLYGDISEAVFLIEHTKLTAEESQ